LGRQPELKDVLKIIDKGKARDACSECQNLPGKPSGPAADAELINFKYLATDIIVDMIVVKSGVMTVRQQY
jgi:hypothetical protein